MSNFFQLNFKVLQQWFYLQKFSDDFRAKKVSENKTVRKFYGTIKPRLVSRRNKPDVIRKGLETEGIVKAVTKELEPEDFFKILVADY